MRNKVDYVLGLARNVRLVGELAEELCQAAGKLAADIEASANTGKRRSETLPAEEVIYTRPRRLNIPQKSGLVRNAG